MVRRGRNTAEWVRLGALARLGQLDRERAAILKEFPNLRRGVPTDIPGIRPTRRISAKARKAMSEGMRRFWAKRKAAEKK
jgi:hypothetical protein